MAELPIIKLEDVSIAYNGQTVLADVNLTIPKGKLALFVGPNGAGKTTLLRAIVGLVPIRSGRIVTPFKRSRPAYVPQQKTIDPLYPVSVRRIVQMGLHWQLGWWRRPDRQARAQIDQVLQWLGLADHVNKVFAELSGGTRQKVLLVRALVSGAEVLVLDEPTSELDERSEQEVLKYLRLVCTEQSKTVLLALHGVAVATSIADLVCQVEHRRVQMQQPACHKLHKTGFQTCTQ
ncbi:MAG: ATP-binding cassette domain-containing protein [Sedimentisphaerales bacterium]|jgi:ABC-type Mn2+/Zn2+ transport system ATPase subunit|nr:ATP-binding cassette domain-containing protein [Sedimentisphaerales bacterium]